MTKQPHGDAAVQSSVCVSCTGETDFGQPQLPDFLVKIWVADLAKPTLANFGVSVFWPSAHEKQNNKMKMSTEEFTLVWKGGAPKGGA